MKSIASGNIAIWLRQRIVVSVRAMRRLPRLRQRLRTLCPSPVTELGIRLPRLAMVAALSSSLMLSGCSMTRKKSVCKRHYVDDDKPITSYRAYATAIEYTALDNITALAVQLSGEPRNLQRTVDDE